jgi:DNA-binding NtrC family response regulator
MPEMDGWTLGRHIKETSPGTPVVMMTVYNSEVVTEAVKQSCYIDTVLFKPFTLDEVDNTIQKATGKGMLASAALIN